jgi:acyl-CoA synthetase (AMP-forming)/AMP-acid ligase II
VRHAPGRDAREAALSLLVGTHDAPLAASYRRGGAWRGETLWAAFAATATRATTKTAVVDGAARTSFAALAGAAEGLAGGLAALGVERGDVVAFQLPNWSETLVVLLACARLGAVANPVLPAYRRRELAFILAESEARVLFIPGRLRDCDHRALVRDLRPELPALAHVVVVRDAAEDARAWEAVAPGASPPPPAPDDAAAIALLIYTSGTTADAKGVLHSHDTLLAEARSLGPVHGLGAGDVVLMPSPLTHVSGIVHALLVPAVFGSTAVLMDRWDAGEALGLLAAERVTYMVGAPTFLRDLAYHEALSTTDVSSFRLFSCGGADVDPALVREAAARLGCVAKRVYGSTEFPTITTTGPADPAERRFDSEGRVIGAAEIRLVDDEGTDVAPGVEGEVLARGPECFLGYRRATLNADTFTADGWFRTGDLGRLDTGGYLRITGRKKEIIIRKGENISARELEDLLAEHPAVAEVAVVGLPDPAAGEIACAVLRLRAGAAPPSLADVAAHLTARGLSRRKLPERLEIVADFPRTASGKIVKRALRERVAAGRP